MAQGLGEYGAIAGGSSGAGDFSSRLHELALTIEDALRNPTPKTWIGIGVFLFIIWFLFLRRR